MGKRGTSGLSLVVGINKPQGMSSHDVVNRCRRIFNERRVGHTGTLDPQATGALAICVGPATRLENYFVGHDKIYQFRVAFGKSTETDDAEGEIIREMLVPEEVLDKEYAQKYLQTLVGKHMQMPPVYSAIKVNGKRAYAQARAGKVIELQPRAIEIYSIKLLGVGTNLNDQLPFEKLPGAIDEIPEEDACYPYWDIEVSVSKGTYIRSLARDIGTGMKTCAYVSRLHRVQAGLLNISQCLSLEALEEIGSEASLDSVRLLGLPITFVRGKNIEDVNCGRTLSMKERQFFMYRARQSEDCVCTGSLTEIKKPTVNGDYVAVVADNTLKAIYAYNEKKQGLVPACVFPIGVSRGTNI